MEYYSAIKKNTFESILMRWMKLEPIIQRSESAIRIHIFPPFSISLTFRSPQRTEFPVLYSSFSLVTCSVYSGTPLQYSCLENPMDGGAWWAAVHGVAKSRTRLSDFTFTFHFHPLEKEMATHSSVLAWRIPGMGEPGGLLSMGSHRIGHDWSDLSSSSSSL